MKLKYSTTAFDSSSNPQLNKISSDRTFSICSPITNKVANFLNTPGWNYYQVHDALVVNIGKCMHYALSVVVYGPWGRQRLWSCSFREGVLKRQRYIEEHFKWCLRHFYWVLLRESCWKICFCALCVEFYMTCKGGHFSFQKWTEKRDNGKESEKVNFIYSRQEIH